MLPTHHADVSTTSRVIANDIQWRLTMSAPKPSGEAGSSATAATVVTALKPAKLCVCGRRRPAACGGVGPSLSLDSSASSSASTAVYSCCSSTTVAATDQGQVSGGRYVHSAHILFLDGTAECQDLSYSKCLTA